MRGPGSSDLAALTAELTAALDRIDRSAAEDVCERVVAGIRRGQLVPDEAQVVDLLAVLRRKRLSVALQRVADVLINHGFDRPNVRVNYAQALLDQELPAAALSLLRGVVTGTAGASDRNEARGLVGRAYKQLYLAGAEDIRHRQQSLDRAIEAYHSVYRSDGTQVWHGINTVALLRRGLRDGVAPAGFADPARYAHDLANDILQRASVLPQDAWAHATAVEACVALDRARDGQEWLRRYVQDRDADAFELASTLRQLVDVWQLTDDAGVGARLLPMLRAALLDREGGAVTVPAEHVRNTDLGDLTDVGLEKIFGEAGFHTLAWFRDALERCRWVARIEDECGDGIGTGFLVDGSALHERLAPAVLLTNAHVIPQAIEPASARVTFRGREPAGPDVERYLIDELVWSSPREALDVSVLTLRRVPDGFVRCPVQPELSPMRSRPQVLIIGHPSGRMKPMFSIQNNLVLDYDNTYVHYTAATLPGSSGSPAFDRDWRLVGLHHSGSEIMRKLHGSGTYPANEGVRISAIRAAIQRDWVDRTGAKRT
jgi:hypothetical protein